MVFIGPQLPPGFASASNSPKTQPDTKHPAAAEQSGLAQSTSIQIPVLHAQRDFLLQNTWRSHRNVGVGLNNLGNSCYMNSVLQCLAYLPPLANICLERGHSRACPLQKGCSCCLLEQQIIRCLTATGRADTPQQIHRSLQLFNRSFVPGRQEDAHEFLRCMVERLERDLLRAEGRYNPARPPRNPDTIVNHLFQGVLRSQVKCLSCGAESNTYDPFMDLSLDIKGCASLKEALARFTQPETLDGANKYRCERCKQLVVARKQMTVHDDPNVLVVHFKRFDGIFGGKISRFIEFPTLFALREHCSAECRQRMQGAPPVVYKLHSLLVHQGGSANSGHYYSYVRGPGNAPEGPWHCMNDSSVTLASSQAVQKVAAYMLCYVRSRMKLPLTVPASEEQQNGQPAAAAAAGEEEEEAAGDGFIGPMLPPAKRQRTSLDAGGSMAANGHVANGALSNGNHSSPAAAAAAAAAPADAVAPPRPSLAASQQPGVTKVGAMGAINALRLKSMQHSSNAAAASAAGSPGLLPRSVSGSKLAPASGSASSGRIDASSLSHSRNPFMRQQGQDKQAPLFAPKQRPQQQEQEEEQQQQQQDSSKQTSSPRAFPALQQQRHKQQEDQQQQQPPAPGSKRSREDIAAEVAARQDSPTFQQRRADVAQRINQLLRGGGGDYPSELRNRIQAWAASGLSAAEAKGLFRRQPALSKQLLQQAVELVRGLYGSLPGPS